MDDTFVTKSALARLGFDVTRKTAGALAGLVPLGAAAAGAALAPEGERLQGAALGLGTGLLVHGAGQSLVNKIAPPAKLAALGINMDVPGTPFRVGYTPGGGNSAPRERLPGMSKWVPRSTLEKAMTGLEGGKSREQLVDEAADHGEFSSPIFGALAGGLAAHHAMPNSGVVGKLMGGITGAALGAGFHSMKSKTQAEEMRQAIRGADGPSGYRPIIQGQGHDSASEAHPVVLQSSYTE